MMIIFKGLIRFLIILGKPILFLFSSYRRAFWYLTLGLGGLVICLLLVVVYREVERDIPLITQISLPPHLSTKINDRKGNLLYNFYVDENRTWTPLQKIPQAFVWATIAIEDKDFYQHPGFSPKGVLQALFFNIKTAGQSGLRGGSTITQQLVKNVYLTQEKTWQRKFREIVLAILIEWKLDKNQILERYFNQVSYGGEIYGAQAAAVKYFGKNVWELTMAQAAYLAGIPAAPTSYSPYGDNPDLAIARMHHVIDEMVSSGFITKEKAEDLKKSPIEIQKKIIAISSPHFVFFVKDFITSHFALTNLAQGGYTITTSIDPEIQKTSEAIVKDELKNIAGLHITNGAALVISVQNGAILSMVGSKDYYAQDIDGKYNITTALRQPGSAIKPINYLLALEKGKSMATLIDDSPISYPIPGQKPYTPQNYTGKYLGTVTLKTALASSLNIPSVKLLAENGVENMAKLGQKMGITSWNDRSRWGLALALGSNEVKMVDLAQAYSIFANMGKKIEINPIEEIRDYQGITVWKKTANPTLFIPPQEAFLINTALSDDGARSPIFGMHSKLAIEGKTVAVKTGTTNSLKDNWSIGWNDTYLVAIWVGNNDGTPMSWVASGVTGATPIWNRIMKSLLAGQPDHPWPVPSGIIKKSICGKEDYFIEGTENGIICPALPTLTPTP